MPTFFVHNISSTTSVHCLQVLINQLNADHFEKQHYFLFFLGSLESVTSSFIEKTDVPSSLWKTHTSEERSDISSELGPHFLC